jgi:hypothetical protein
MAGGAQRSFGNLQSRFMQVCESEVCSDAFTRVWMCSDVFIHVHVVCRASSSVFLTVAVPGKVKGVWTRREFMVIGR